MYSSKLAKALILSIAILPASLSRGQDFMEDVQQASAELEAPQEVAGKMLLGGDLSGSTKYLMDAFPESTRTLSQAFVLGNILFAAAPEVSYELHKKVAKELPDEPYAQLEWALQQHRQKEYAGAVEAYSVVTKAMPDRAVFHGLQAECFIQIGRIEEAVAAWKRSEAAKNGTLVDLESMVCEINGGFLPLGKRCLLIERVRAGDLEAAEELVVHDAAYTTDWWNTNVNARFLRDDIELIRGMKSDEKKDVDEIVRVGIIILAAEKDAEAAKSAFVQNRLLLDDAHSLPTRAKLASQLFGILETHKLMKNDAMRTTWEEQLTDRALSEKSEVLFNIVAHMNLGTDRLPEIQDLAWKITGGEVFATSRIAALDANDKLTLNDPLLKEAIERFPRNGVIAESFLRCTIAAKQPTKDALIQAIKAEYSHFSMGPGLYVRRSARKLRAYFQLLSQELAKK